MRFTGRKKLLTDYTIDDLTSEDLVVEVLKTAYRNHLVNRSDIDYLINYRNGIQPILQKQKEIRPEINHKVVINHAEMITRNIVGYFLGTPIQYIQAGVEGKDEVELLNKYVSYENKSHVDVEIGELQSICGTAYRIIYTDGAHADDVPFELRSLDPRNTFVVYENNISEQPVLGATYYTMYGEDNSVIGTKFYAYTYFGMYIITFTGLEPWGEGKREFFPYDVGGIPIVEYPNNQWRIGDWELALNLMDAINELQSTRMDDIDQIVQSLLVFINAEIDEDRYEEMRKSGVVMLTNLGGAQSKSDIKTIETHIDQNGLNMYSEELERLLYAMIGIPDRNNRANGGGDTGQAVELRDGWADLEIVARNKESAFKKAEKNTLRIILNILRNIEGFSLSPLDVEIKFSRNKNNNLLVKTQSLQTLISTRTLTPADCLTVVDLVSDVNEFVSRGEDFWGELFAGKQESQIALAQSQIQTDTQNDGMDGKPTEKLPDEE